MATNSRENGLVFDSVTDRFDFSGIKVDYTGSQGVSDRVPRNSQRRFNAGDDWVAISDSGTAGHKFG